MAIYHGKPYDPDFLCQDDFEWLTETGPYAYTRVAIIRRGLNKRRDAVLATRKRMSRSLLQACQQCPHSVALLALETVRDALTKQVCTLDFRLALLDAYPHEGYYWLMRPTMRYDPTRECFSAPFPDGRVLCTTTETFLQAMATMPFEDVNYPIKWEPFVDGKTVWIVEVDPSGHPLY